jgi:hypothetical protein
MARYFDARGHLSCDFEQIPEIRSIVDSVGSGSEWWQREPNRLELYRSGWLYQAKPINWIGHVFYGASVQFDGVDLLKDCLRMIALRFPDITGVFFVDDEEGEIHEVVRVADSMVSIVSE